MHDNAPAAHRYAALGLIACSMLIHEILLTRICALRLYFHFAFLVISNCLLGLGASGALLVAWHARLRSAPRRWLGRIALAYTASLIATFVFLRACPLPEDLVLSNPAHLFALSAFNVAGAVPFVFGGLCVGMLLTLDVARVNRLYAVDLLGAGLGCIACPVLLPRVGAGGVFIVSALLGLLALVAIESDRYRARAFVVAALFGAAGLFLLPRLDQLAPIPSRPVEEYAHHAWDWSRYGGDYRVWTSNSRIDLIRMPPGSPPVIFMRGPARDVQPPLPEWAAIFQDANAGTSIIDFSEHPAALDALRHSMYSAAYRLKPQSRVLVIGLGGGNDVWAAKANGAVSVKAIELNWPIIDLHRRVLRRYSQALAADPSVELVADEGRSALMRESARYDVIQMSGIDTWTALASGAYVLAENYLYTREAIASMYRRLQPGGIIQIARFAATMEGLRLLSTMQAALGALGVRDFEHSVIALATPDKMMAVQLKKGAFSRAEQDSVQQFARDNAIDLLYLPQRPAPGIIDRFIRARDRQRIIDGFATNLAPTDDDRPYFFNYAKWQHPIESLRHFHDLPAASQGNPLFVLMQFVLSLVLSAVIVIWPTARRVQFAVRGRWHQLGYFCGLGLGFIFVEIAVIQKLTLLLGQPMYSLTVTLFSLLVFTGIGSLMLGGRFAVRSGWIWVVPLALAAYLVLFALAAPSFVAHCIGLPLPTRIGITALALAPLGLLLGVPFAHGLRVLHAEAPVLLPWAWAINGCSSVVGSILTVIVSMNFGFALVLCSAAVFYLAAFALHALRPPSVGAA